MVATCFAVWILKLHVFQRKKDDTDFTSVFSSNACLFQEYFVLQLTLSTQNNTQCRKKNQFQLRIEMIYVLFLQKKQTKFDANRFPWLTNPVDWKRCAKAKKRTFRGSQVIGRISLIHRYNLILITTQNRFHRIRIKKTSPIQRRI